MILSPTHTQWEEFIKLLRKELNFRIEKDGNVIWDCEENFDITRRLLNYLGEFDTEKTICEFMKLGVSCDCGVIIIIANE
jgi:hypothetical protein